VAAGAPNLVGRRGDPLWRTGCLMHTRMHIDDDEYYETCVYIICIYVGEAAVTRHEIENILASVLLLLQLEHDCL
jgi:hypothetical protein